MILSDGRRIVPRASGGAPQANIVPMHPDFRMVVLANRPGFPFLGNDFFGALGDLFSTHSVDNPSTRSEIQLLKQYGPHVDGRVINKLVKAFGELRSMADQGLVSYPYSTREVVNIVKHLEVSSGSRFLAGEFLFDDVRSEKSPRPKFLCRIRRNKMIHPENNAYDRLG